MELSMCFIIDHDDEETSSPGDQGEGAQAINFFVKKKTTGRVTHHLQVGLYRFNRRRVKPSGAGYFTCAKKNCKASVKVTYVDIAEEPTHYEILNDVHSHPPDVTNDEANDDDDYENVAEADIVYESDSF